MPPRKQGKVAKSSQKPKCNLPPSPEPPGPIFHFQAWYVNNEPASECIVHNESLAKLIERSLHQLSRDSKRLLIVKASTPEPTQSLVVPVSIQIQKRPNTSADEGRLINLITSFRDHNYPEIAKGFFKELKKCLDFYNVFATTTSGERLDVHTKVIVCKKMSEHVHAVLQSTREESWGDIAYGLVEGVLVGTPKSVWRAGSFLLKRLSSQDSKQSLFDKSDELATDKDSTPASGSSGKDNYDEINACAEAARDLLQKATTQDNTPLIGAAAEIADPFLQFKRRFKNLNEIIRNAIDTGGLKPNTIWAAMDDMRALQLATDQLIQTINTTELLDKIETKHSSTKSTGCAIGTGVATCVAAYGAMLILTGPTSCLWFAGWVASHYWASVAITGVSTLAAVSCNAQRKDHNIARKKCRDARIDIESFQDRYKTLKRNLTICFAQSLQYDLALKTDPKAKQAFLGQFGIDLDCLADERYPPEQIRQARKNLENAYETLTKNIEWLIKNEGLKFGTST